MVFKSRVEAGKKLAEKLSSVGSNGVVLGLARGGVVIAATIAKELKLPFDVIIVRKIPAPGNEELALGAVAEDGKPLFNDRIVSTMSVSKEYLQSEVERQRELIQKRKKLYREGRSLQEIKDKVAIIVDDGIATGATMRAAIGAVKLKKPSKIILAIPVAAREAFQELSKEVDEAICLSLPQYFEAVGAFYREFDQVSDVEVIALLNQG